MVANTQIAREAPFLEDYRRRLMDSAFDATKQPVVPQGRGIADFDAFQQAGFGAGAGQLGYSFDPFISSGLSGIQQGQQTTAQGIPAIQQAQKQYDPSTSNYQQFFNQYQADVTKDALKQMDQQAAEAENRLSDRAREAGSFGGSRFGVQQAELAKNLQDIKSQRIFQDLSNNYQQAQGNAMNTFEQAQARNLGAGQAFGQLGTGQAQLGQGIAGLGQLNFGLGQQGVGQLFGMGQQRQTRDQALSDEQLRNNKNHLLD